MIAGAKAKLRGEFIYCIFTSFQIYHPGLQREARFVELLCF